MVLGPSQKAFSQTAAPSPRPWIGLASRVRAHCRATPDLHLQTQLPSIPVLERMPELQIVHVAKGDLRLGLLTIVESVDAVSKALDPH